MSTTHHLWWHRAAVYQIYPRSFQDSTGNGIGDLQGIINRVDYLVDLGVDAVWLSPFYPSPMADFGYDVSDYCNVDPLFGDLATFDALVETLHQHDLRLIIDYVPNHTSDEHPWFVEARSSRDNPKRDWYIWHDPAPDGSLPNNWESFFGGPAWTFDERTGQYYLHQFHTKQPDLNWRNPAVRQAMLDVLRFWLDRGVDGFRMDVVTMIIKDEQLRDNPTVPVPALGASTQQRLYTQDQPEVHPILQEIRQLADSYPHNPVLIGEVWASPETWASYYGPANDELHIPFNFRLIDAEWSAEVIATIVNQTERIVPESGWPNYVLGSHDVPRLASRVGEAQARIGAMLLLTLRGMPTLYYGDELGLPNGEIPADASLDPQYVNGGGFNRDKSRTPMQWSGEQHAGFTDASAPWLPTSPDAATRNAAAQSEDQRSTLSLYRALLRLRGESDALQIGTYTYQESPTGTMCYHRQHGEEWKAVCLNFTDQPQTVAISRPGRVVLSTHMDAHYTTDEIRLRPHEGVIVGG